MLLLAAGCTQSNVPDDLYHLDGLWGLTTDRTAPLDGRYEEYVRFYTDDSFEYFYITSTEYVYHTGSYTINKGEIEMTYKGLRRFAVADEVPRLIDSYYASNSLDKGILVITDYGTDKMVLKANSGKINLFKTKEVYGWKDEFSAPAVPVSVDALLGAWDQLDFYQYAGWSGVTWWYFFEPDKNGMTLEEDGVMTYCPFWSNRVLEKQINAYKLSANEQVVINPADCSWSLSGDTLTMTCSRYLAYTPDASGYPTAEHTETPEQPVSIRFMVQTLTPDYLILYNGETMLYHAFCRHKADTQPGQDKAPQRRLFSPAQEALRQWR